MPAFFTQLLIRNTPPDVIFEDYLQWILTLKAFDKGRPTLDGDRIASPIHIDDLRVSADHDVDGRSTLSIRRSRSPDDLALIKISQPDERSDLTRWKNFIRIRGEGNDTRVEHSVGRASQDPTASIHPMSSVPRIVRTLLSSYATRGIEPRDLHARQIRCEDAQETDAFIQHVLLPASRRIPIVMLSPQAKDEKIIVDQGLVARSLQGMATVAVLTSRACTQALTNALDRLDMPPQYGCFDGGVRIYFPKLSASDATHRHPLWTRTTLLRLSEEFEKRSELISRQLAFRIAQKTTPQDLLRSVETFDRAERRRKTAQISLAWIPDHATSVDSVEPFIREASEKVTLLKAEIDHANELIDLLEDDNQDKVQKLEDATSRIDDLEYRIQQDRIKAEALEQQIEAKKNAEDARGAAMIPEDIRSALSLAMRSAMSPPPEASLRLAAAAWPDRIVVLDSALKSAKKSSKFKHGNVAMDLIARLATDYYDAIRKSGDVEAKKIFGKNEFASLESTPVRNRESATRRRTFLYKGTPTTMLAHLKIGGKDSSTETLRIHFHWDPVDQRIVIGHCGPHLDFD